MRTKRGLNHTQTIHTDKVANRQVSFFNFKGTPSREEDETSFSIFTTFESAFSGRIGIILASHVAVRPISSFFCCSVQRHK